MSALLLFDIDGTLVTTGRAGHRAMATAAAQRFGDGFSFEDVRFAGKLDGAIFAEAARNSGIDGAEDHEPEFRRIYLEELDQELQRRREHVRSLPGVAELLETLIERSRNGAALVLGLLSGNYTAAAPLKLRAAGIDPGWFPVTAFGDDAATRPDLVPVARRRYERHTGEPSDPSRVVVIGDTPRDVDCAKSHGCVAFAVATGEYTSAQLAESGADVVVEDLTRAAPLLELL